MSKGLKLFFGISYLIILTIFLYLIFSLVEISRLNDFTYYKELQSIIEGTIGKNFYLNLFLFFIFSIVWISLLGFGTPLLLISGILFGKWIGTSISVMSISVGALSLYVISNFFFQEIIFKTLNKNFYKYINLFQKNEFYYFFAFRLAGGLGIPFGIQNILPTIFNIKYSNYFFASFLGFIPIFFIWNSIGSGLNNYIKQSDNFSFLSFILTKDIYLPIILFIIILFISMIIKKKIFDKA